MNDFLPKLIAWETTRACPLACKHCRAAAKPEPDRDELSTAGSAVVEMEMSTQPRGAKPGEVLAAIGDFIDIRARRTHQWIERDGARQEPLDADTRPRVPEARAS